MMKSKYLEIKHPVQHEMEKKIQLFKNNCDGVVTGECRVSHGQNTRQIPSTR